MTKYEWEITLADDSVVKEADDNSFNLSWEDPGVVKKIVLVDSENDVNFVSVNLSNGEFMSVPAEGDGFSETPEGFSGSFGDYGLRFFRRNTVIHNAELEPLSHKIAYYVGYVIGGEEKLLRIDPDDVREYAER